MAGAPAITVSRLPITHARIHLGQPTRRAHVNKEYFILEKDGIPVIGIMDADEMEDYLELHDASVGRFIRQSQRQHLAGKGRPAEQLLTELRRRKEPSRRRAGP